MIGAGDEGSTMSHRGEGPADPGLIPRIAVAAEIALLIVGGALAARALAGVLGLPGRSERDALLFGAASPDWAAAASVETIQLATRYGATFAAALLLAYVVGGPTRRLAGLSRGGRSMVSLVGFGLLMGLILNIPAHAGRLAQHRFGLGDNTPMWNLMESASWTADFWLFMAASSFLLIPIVEELLFRSYALGRLRMHYTAGGAVLICSALFWVSHGQYIKPDPYLLYNSALAFVVPAFWAWSVVRTGSVAPAVVAHAVANVPVAPSLLAASIGVSVVLLLVFRRSVGRSLQDFIRLIAGTREWLTLIALVAGLTALALIIRSDPSTIAPLTAGVGAVALLGVLRRALIWRGGRAKKP